MLFDIVEQHFKRNVELRARRVKSFHEVSRARLRRSRGRAPTAGQQHEGPGVMLTPGPWLGLRAALVLDEADAVGSVVAVWRTARG
jgi:hypothetical protein